MKAHGSPTAKRTSVWSNTDDISMFDLGPMTREELMSEIKTAEKYINKDGKTAYKGTKALKATQLLGSSGVRFGLLSVMPWDFLLIKDCMRPCTCPIYIIWETGVWGNTPVALLAKWWSGLVGLCFLIPLNTLTHSEKTASYNVSLFKFSYIGEHGCFSLHGV